MSDQDSSMSMNSIMQAIYGDHHTEYFIQHEDQFVQQMPQFMQTLINYLIQLCVTQGFADNVSRTLTPWIKQVKLNSKNPKPAIEGFLQDFLRLYEQQTQKINKYGQKKLKYLIKTVSKQIFTQIMRTACDLKLESVNRSNSTYSTHRKINNITLLTSSINLIIEKDMKYFFTLFKKSYAHAINKQEKFITNFTNSINKLDRLCTKKRKNKLWKAMFLWRANSIEFSQQQSLLVYEYGKQFFRSTLPDIVRNWQHKPSNWLTVIIDQLSNLVRNLVGENDGILFEFIANPNIQGLNSLNYSAMSSYRSGISQISSIEVEEYLKNEEIKYSTVSKFLAIPIIADHQIGLIKISWQYQLPIVLFNRTLRLVELIKQIIQGYAKITTRLGYYNIEYEYNSWHEHLLELALKEEPLDLSAFEAIFCAANITLLEIYHDRNSPSLCIKYDRLNAQEIPHKIYQLIWEKLDNNSCFKLDRENTNYQVLRLEQHGFCRYSFEEIEQTKNINKTAIIQCIVPLLTKNLGKIGCHHCNIKVKELVPTLISVMEQGCPHQEPKVDYDYELMMKLKDSQTINEMESCYYQLIKKSFPKTNIFARVLYWASEDKNICAYRNLQKGIMQAIQVPKIIVNENSFGLQANQIDQKLIRIVKLLHSNPLFSQSELYIYQNEKRKKLKVQVKRIGRRAILLLGTYQKNLEQQFQQILKVISGQIEENSQLFSKKDIYTWSTQIIQSKNSMNTLNLQLQYNYLSEISQLNFIQLIKKVGATLPCLSSMFMWVISQQKPTLLIGNETQEMKSSKLPYQHLIQQSIKSHHSVKGAHRVTRISKNYGKKIQQILSYVPNFAVEEQKLKFAEIVHSCIEEKGQQTQSCFYDISQYLEKTEQFSKTKNQFISVPIEYKRKTYIIILIYNREAYISEQNFIALETYLRRTVSEILDKKYLQMKKNSLCSISQFRKSNNLEFVEIKTHGKIKQIINKYKINVIETKIRNTNFMKILKKTYENNLFHRVKQCFNQLSRHSFSITSKYQKNCQFLSKKLEKIFAYYPFFTRLNSHLNYLKGINMLQNVYKRIISQENFERVSKSRVFFMIELFGKGKLEIKKNRRQISLKMVIDRMEKIKRRNMLEIFIKNVENVLSLKRSLKILQEQFLLMQPRNVKTSINFIVGRLNLMLNQHYAMPITVQVINCGYQPAQTSKILQKQNFIFIENSSFAFTISIQNGNEFSFDKLNTYVESTLSEILPKWEINHRKHQILRLKIMYEFLQRYRKSNLVKLFSMGKSQKNKQIIENCENMRKKANKEKQKMIQLQYSFNTATNVQNREKHRRNIAQIKQNANIIQNELYKVGVQVKIKSKTNSAYRMMNILNKNKFDWKIQENQQNLSPNQQHLQEIQQNLRQDRLRHFFEAFPMWNCALARIFQRSYKARAHQFMSKLHNLYG